MPIKSSGILAAYIGRWVYWVQMSLGMPVEGSFADDYMLPHACFEDNKAFVHKACCASRHLNMKPTCLQGSNSAPSTVCAVTVAINIVRHLAVVHNLAVGGVDPVQEACCGFLTVGPISWPCCRAVSEGAVQPVYACVPHANYLILPIQACSGTGRIASQRLGLQDINA